MGVSPRSPTQVEPQTSIVLEFDETPVTWLGKGFTALAIVILIALSIRTVAEVPLRFVGVGEKPGDLELFDPDRLASRLAASSNARRFSNVTVKAS